MALEFFCGAGALEMASNGETALYSHIAKVTAFLVSIRGYLAVIELAQ